MEFKDKEVVQTPSVKRYEIGSQTKMFTALLVFKALDEGKLSLSDEVSKYVDASFLKYNHKATNKTYDVSHNTIKELVSHNIKAPDLINYGKSVKDPEIFNILSNINMDMSTDEGIMHSIEILNQATEEDINNGAYNNTGYWLLGKVIANVNNSSYEDAIKKHITAPLGMENTNWDNSDVVGSAGGKKHLFSTKFYGPAGGLVSTYKDMNKFMTKFETLLKPETVKLWKELALSRPLGAGLINLTKAVKVQYDLSNDWWGHAGQTLQMQSGSFINENNEVLLITTDDAFFNPFAKVFEVLKK